MNTKCTTLTLQLPREVDKIMPWVIAAKATRDAKQIAWAKREHGIASERARQRERWEAEREDRRLKRERELQDRSAREEFWNEYDREMRELWAREDRQKKYWAMLGFPLAFEEGFSEPQPAHSSQKGWRRLLSEFSQDEIGGSAQWGFMVKLSFKSRVSYRNRGRKPRKPWFK